MFWLPVSFKNDRNLKEMSQITWDHISSRTYMLYSGLFWVGLDHVDDYLHCITFSSNFSSARYIYVNILVTVTEVYLYKWQAKKI